MSDTAENNSATSPDFEAILRDIAVLKQDLATLLKHLKIGPQDSLGEAAGQVNDEARHAYDALAAQGEHSMKAINRHLEEQPLLFVAGAFAIGLLSGRILSR